MKNKKGKIREILDQVRPKLKPTREDRVIEKKILRDIRASLKQAINEVHPGLGVHLAGSLAKDTDLTKTKDIDFFVMFPKSVTPKTLEKEGLEIGKKTLEKLDCEIQISYADHPYTKGEYKGFIVEIVPCYRIGKNEKIKSAVDRTPLHTNFVKGKIAKNRKLAEEIRLLKMFMECSNIYGAEASVEGFSGYLCELLVIKYGSFLKVLSEFSDLDTAEPPFLITSLDKKRIEPEKLKRRFKGSALIVIDPVDSERNVSAAVSVKSAKKFIELSRRFINSPSMEYFKKKEVKPLADNELRGILKKRKNEFIIISFSTPDLPSETLIPQLSKSLDALSKSLMRKGFRVVKTGFWHSKTNTLFLIELSASKLPKIESRVGPRYDPNDKNFKNFLKKNRKKALSKPYRVGNNVAIDLKREYTDAITFTRDFMKNPLGFGKNLRELKKYKIHPGMEIYKLKNDEFRKWLRTYFQERY